MPALTHRLVLALSLCCLALPAWAEWYSGNESIMGTSVSVTLWAEEQALGEEAVAAVMAEMRRVDQTLSPYIETSELSRINQSAAQATVPISEEMVALIDKALYFSRITDGAFDISFASVGQFYDYRQQRQPSASEREENLRAVDYRRIQLDRAAKTLHFDHPQLKIDLGGIAKGYAVDRAIELLRLRGIEYATVSAGGDSRLLGDKRGKPWLIGIKNPRYGSQNNPAGAADEVAIVLPLDNVAVSTSGDYERYFLDSDSGERIHHILNPQTGKSAAGVASVTIIGPQGFDTDPMSTSVFVMGVAKGLHMVNGLPNFDAIIIDSAGKVHYSEGLAPPN